MYYIDLNDKQKSYIYSKCSVKHIKDVGPRSIMYKRLNSNAFFINTFVTNFNEKFLYEPYVENSESYYSWEYDIIYVPFKYADMVNKLLNITNENISLMVNKNVNNIQSTLAQSARRMYIVNNNGKLVEFKKTQTF